MGRRIVKIVNGGVVNRWFWDGAQLRAEQVGGSIRVYDFDPTSIDLLLLVTGPASVLDGTSGVLFFQRDALGNVTRLINSQRDRVESYIYDAFEESRRRFENRPSDLIIILRRVIEGPKPLNF